MPRTNPVGRGAPARRSRRRPGGAERPHPEPDDEGAARHPERAHEARRDLREHDEDDGDEGRVGRERHERDGERPRGPVLRRLREQVRLKRPGLCRGGEPERGALEEEHSPFYRLGPGKR